MTYYKSPLVIEKDLTFGCSQDVVEVVTSTTVTQTVFSSDDITDGTVIPGSTYTNGGLTYMTTKDESSDSLEFRIGGLQAFTVFTIHNIGFSNDQPIEFRTRRDANEYVLIVETPLVADTAFEIIWTS